MTNTNTNSHLQNGILNKKTDAKYSTSIVLNLDKYKVNLSVN